MYSRVIWASQDCGCHANTNNVARATCGDDTSKVRAGFVETGLLFWVATFMDSVFPSMLMTTTNMVKMVLTSVLLSTLFCRRLLGWSFAMIRNEYTSTGTLAWRYSKYHKMSWYYDLHVLKQVVWDTRFGNGDPIISYHRHHLRISPKYAHSK